MRGVRKAGSFCRLFFFGGRGLLVAFSFVDVWCMRIFPFVMFGVCGAGGVVGFSFVMPGVFWKDFLRKRALGKGDPK